MGNNILEIIVKATTTQATNELKKLDKAMGDFGLKTLADLKKKWTDFDQSLSGAKGPEAMIKSWTGVVGIAGSVVGGLVAAGAAVKGLTDDFTEYAFQVEDFGRLIGATPEEASKLIQVADDVRLSTETMTMALKNAVSQGYEPNIAGLQKMADEYNAIQDPIERSRYLMEVFGKRAGPEMAKMLELGSAKIQEMGDSIEGTARLMTEEGIRAAEEYYAALDTLGDSATDLKLAIGGQLTPVVTDATNVMNGMTENITNSTLPAFFDLAEAVAQNKFSMYDLTTVLGLYVSGAMTGADVTRVLDGVTREYLISLGLTEESLTGINPDMAELVRNSNAAAVAIDGETTALTLANEVFGFASTAIRTYVTDSDMATRAQDALALATGKVTIEEIRMRDSIMILTEMMDNKIITPQRWAEMMAVLSDETTTAADKVLYLKRQIDALKNKTVQIYVNVDGSRGYEQLLSPTGAERKPKNPTTAKPKPGGATGLDMIVPPGYPGDSFPVYATSGERVTILTAAQQKMQTGGNTVNNYNLTIQSNARTESLERDFAIMKAWV